MDPLGRKILQVALLCKSAVTKTTFKGGFNERTFNMDHHKKAFYLEYSNRDGYNSKTIPV